MEHDIVKTSNHHAEHAEQPATISTTIPGNIVLGQDATIRPTTGRRSSERSPQTTLQDLKLQAQFLSAGETMHIGKRGEDQIWRRNVELGHGAFGTVWKEDWISGSSGTPEKVRAVKQSPRHQQRAWQRELEALHKFSMHPHYFVRCLGWFEDPHWLYIAMEYIPYGTLQAQINVRSLPEAEAAVVIAQLAQALKCMHDVGFIHRDLKPLNILVNRPGPDWHVKIADFGISKDTAIGGSTAGFQGTPSYTAPEIFSATSGRYTLAVDIWALGAVAFCLLTRVPPFEAIREMILFADRITRFPTKPLGRLSYDCVQFILETMAPTRETRLTIAQVISHPWLQPEQPLEESIRNLTISTLPAASNAWEDTFATQSRDTFITPALTSGPPHNPFMTQSSDLVDLSADNPLAENIGQSQIGSAALKPNPLDSIGQNPSNPAWIPDLSRAASGPRRNPFAVGGPIQLNAVPTPDPSNATAKLDPFPAVPRADSAHLPRIDNLPRSDSADAVLAPNPLLAGSKSASRGPQRFGHLQRTIGEPATNGANPGTTTGKGQSNVSKEPPVVSGTVEGNSVRKKLFSEEKQSKRNISPKHSNLEASEGKEPQRDSPPQYQLGSPVAHSDASDFQYNITIWTIEMDELEEGNAWHQKGVYAVVTISDPRQMRSNTSLTWDAPFNLRARKSSVLHFTLFKERESKNVNHDFHGKVSAFVEDLIDLKHTSDCRTFIREWKSKNANHDFLGWVRVCVGDLIDLTDTSDCSETFTRDLKTDNLSMDAWFRRTLKFRILSKGRVPDANTKTTSQANRWEQRKVLFG